MFLQIDICCVLFETRSNDRQRGKKKFLVVDSAKTQLDVTGNKKACRETNVSVEDIDIHTYVPPEN